MFSELDMPTWLSRGYTFKFQYTVNQLNLTALKFSFQNTQTYLVQENLAF